MRDLLTRTDMVIVPVTSIEEHGHQVPSEDTEAWVAAAGSFIERWKQLRPVGAK